MQTALLTTILLGMLSLRLLFYFDAKPTYVPGQEVTLNHTLFSYPKISYGRQLIRVEGLWIYAPAYPSYQYGDRLRIQGVVKEKESSAKNGEVIKRLVIDNPRITKSPPAVYLQPLVVLRNSVEQRFLSVLSKDEAGLLLGIVLGVKNELGDSFYEALKKTGVLHVVAASGSNVSILTGIMLILFSHLLRRSFAVLFTVLTIFGYMVLSGMDPPIVRASIMGVLAFAAVLVGRQYFSLLALFLTGWCMLLISPELLFDVGFWLSATATAGIILFRPVFEGWIPGNLFVREDISITLAAQVGVLPLLFYFFNSFPLMSVLVNVLVLWTVPILMMLGGLAALLSFLPLVPDLLLYITYPLLWYFKEVVLFFTAFPLPIELERVPFIFIPAYYLLLLALILYQKQKA